MSADPDGAWVTQQARNLVMDLDDETEIHRMRFLLRDRDAKYCRSFDAVFAAEGMKVVLTPYRSPQANGHVERLIGGLRREILDHVLILHRRHLGDVLREYAAHHNSHRPHRGLGLRRPHDVGRSIPGLGPARPEAITRREIFRRAAAAENEVYHAGIEMPLLRSGEGELTSMEMASKMRVDLVPLLDQAVFAAYRRQQELVWTEHQVEHIEPALESAGISLPPGPPPAMTFIDLSGYTRLTEERGDQAAASVAARLSDIVQVSPRRYRGEVVKWVGDGVMFRFRDPGGAVQSALQIVQEIPAAGLPPAHIGVAAGPVIQQGGDYYGRTVNLASRISDRAAGGQILVNGLVVDTTSVPDVRFDSIGMVDLDGIPVNSCESHPDGAGGADEGKRFGVESEQLS